MVWLLSFLFVFLGLVCYLLFAPWYLELNTETGIYQVRFHRLARVGIRVVSQQMQVYIQIAWYTKLINNLHSKDNKPKERKNEERKKNTAAGKKKWKRVSMQQIKAVARSFQIRTCYVSIDTGEQELNGMLYPVFYIMGTVTKQPIYINFMGENKVVLVIRNTIARILLAFIFNSSSLK